MATLLRAKARGKFRPCRGDVPKRIVAHVPHGGFPTISLVAYGDKIDGIKLLSMPSTDSVRRSGIGTAHHLRRFPIVITVSGERTARNLSRKLRWLDGWLRDRFPSCKPKLEDSRIRVILWADEAKIVRETLLAPFRVQEC